MDHLDADIKFQINITFQCSTDAIVSWRWFVFFFLRPVISRLFLCVVQNVTSAAVYLRCALAQTFVS